MTDRLEVFRIREVGSKEGANLDRGVGKAWTIKADRYNDYGVFKGRLIVTNDNPREILETSPEGFVITRCAYDFV